MADGLPEGALFIQQLLNGFILTQFIVFYYLEKHTTLLDGQWWCCENSAHTTNTAGKRHEGINRKLSLTGKAQFTIAVSNF